MSDKIKALVDAGIDLKLTKADLIEMIVCEREDTLTSELEEIDNKLKEHRALLPKLMDSYYPMFEEDTLKHASSFIKSFIKLTGVDEKDVQFKVHFKRGKTYSERKAYEIRNNCKVSSYSNPGTLDCPILVIKLKGYNPIEIQKISNVKFSATTKHELAKIDNLLNEILSLSEDRGRIYNELNNLTKMGKRAKANLVKEMLMSTDQGQEILTSLGKVGKLKLLK